MKREISGEVTLGNLTESERLERKQGLEREQRDLEMNANIGRPNKILLN